jgi:hypothetical protein
MVMRQTQATDSVQITAKGIKNALAKYKETQAIAELIWNGFDAKATRVEVKYSVGPCDIVDSLSVMDNGYGIPHNALRDKFKPFHESEKIIEDEDVRNSSVKHGKNGVGRLTFFKVADKAVWNTVYKEGAQLTEYNIEIDEKTIDKYEATRPTASTKKQTGTEVKLTGEFVITGLKFEREIIPYLKLEFGWFLELNKAHKYKLVVNDHELDYSDIIGDHDTATFIHNATGTRFDIWYIRWVEGTNKEFSKYYYINQHDEEKWKEYTRLNKKGDRFYHSVYIKSSYFENFNWHSSPTARMQGLAGTGIKSDAQFEFLQTQLHSFLRAKRSPFVREYANQLVKDFEQEEIIPKISNDWDKPRIDALKDTVKGLYEVQPKIFTGMNLEQKKTFVRLLDLILDSDERERILDIIKEVVDLTPEEKEQLHSLFKITSLSRITQTIRLVKDRYRAISNLKQLINDGDIKANEASIQEFVENHYWIFGEQYTLVTAAEPDMEEALRRYLYRLHGFKKPVKMDHPDKNKEMDIFLCRQRHSGFIENIIVELKHPNKPLGKKELDQIETYMRTILNTPLFQNRNTKWTFYLIGNKFLQKAQESVTQIQSQIEMLKPWGEIHLGLALINESLNYKVYVKKWSEIFDEFELRHQFLNEKLELRRKLIVEKHKTAEEVITAAKDNVAVMPGEVVVA